ncbi:NXPE family member 4-like [Haliotis cracherodii]|uniref:NXPE family member 4-like n=1 Tax=Haliotis cracherodii TaxID=6455 RepID=UPI0039EC3848
MRLSRLSVVQWIFVVTFTMWSYRCVLNLLQLQNKREYRHLAKPRFHLRPFSKRETKSNNSDHVLKEPNTSLYHIQTHEMSPLNCARASESKIHLISKSYIYSIGEKIEVRIQTFNGHGLPMTRGGDLVRVWIKEVAKSACAAGSVIDNQNGTYTATIIPRWVGNVTVMAAIAAPRELIDMFHRVYHRNGSLNTMMARFETGGVSEESPCLPTPHIRGFSKLCNFSKKIGGLPFYCGHPVNLQCHNWVAVRTPLGQGRRFTQDEKKMFIRELFHQTIPGSLEVKVTDGKTKQNWPVRTHQTSSRSTWSQRSGYFLNWIWHQGEGHALSGEGHSGRNDIFVTRLSTCLANRRLWLIGDSTLRHWLEFISQKLHTQRKQTSEDILHPHQPLLLKDKSRNISIFWGPHGLPFHHGSTWHSPDVNRAAHQYLDEATSESEDIYIINLYVHFHAFPEEVFRAHVKRLAESLGSLLTRAPKVKVAINGPHAFHGLNKAGFVDDYFGPVYDSILRSELHHLRDHVIYLDFWDMTVACENVDIHPNVTVVQAMIDVMIKHVCR